MKFFYKKHKILGLIAICIAIMLSFQIVSATTPNDSRAVNTQENPKISAQISGTEYDWLNNSGFDSSISPWKNETQGDERDVNASISGGFANYEILGEKKSYSLEIAPDDTWKVSNNPDWGPLPNLADYDNDYGTDEYGAYLTYQWDEDGAGGQTGATPSVQWKKNITLPDDMSDYNITSMSLNAEFNATVQAQFRTSGGIDTPLDGIFPADQYDYARFYLSISDVENNRGPFRVANNRTIYLGKDSVPNPPNEDYIYDKNMTAIPEKDLIYYINSVLENNHTSFMILVGIDIYCEDNDASYDHDYWKRLRIKNVTFSLNYERIMNKFTSISWKQDGRKISNLSQYEVKATSANLKFKYKIDKNWTKYTLDLNSEIRVLLNGNEHPITIKLSKINFTTIEEADFDLIPPIDSVNLSIQVYLRDEFGLDEVITISIDNVTLDISYIIFAPDPVADGGGGGGGGRTIIRGEDYTLVVIGLVAAIIALVTFFGAYQKHYKYPPMVRKIRKLRKKIKKGKSVKSLIVKNRKNIVDSDFQKEMKILEVDVVSSKEMSKVDKISKVSNDKKIIGGAK